ncbi:MAG: NADH-quinone oxidoreductase subunit NuoE [Bacteroidales bacterium]|nr:NADH-quinone oxidoreductase subunit NuoE [Bacteroidales bacterium]
MDKVVDEIINRYRQGKKEDLIPILQEIERSTGHISEHAIVSIGRLLKISTTKIFGLATFYDQFRFFPTGRVHIRVCHGTTCFMNGSGGVLSALKEELGIEPGQTTRDGRFSYEIVTCMGGCSSGPVVQVNEEYHTGIRSEQIPAMVKKMKQLAENE